MLNKKNIFLRIYELKDKLCNLIKQKSKQKKKKNTVLRDLSSCIIEKLKGAEATYI